MSRESPHKRVMPQKNYFQILGVAKGSGPEEVKRAYREQAFRYHPDKTGGGQEATKRFLEIREAYDVLSDNSSRTRHERELDSINIPVRRDSFPPMRYGDFRRGHISPLTGFSYSGTMDRQPGSESQTCDFTLTAEEAQYGTERIIRIGTPFKPVRIAVDIPPGICDGSLLEVVGPRTRRLGIRVFLRARILG